MSGVAWLYAIQEPAQDIFAIPVPPSPLVSQPPRRARVRWSRRLVLRLANLGAWAMLGAVLYATGMFQ